MNRQDATKKVRVLLKKHPNRLAQIAALTLPWSRRYAMLGMGLEEAQELLEKADRALVDRVVLFNLRKHQPNALLRKWVTVSTRETTITNPSDDFARVRRLLARDAGIREEDINGQLYSIVIEIIR